MSHLEDRYISQASYDCYQTDYYLPKPPSIEDKYYEQKLKAYRDVKNSINTAHDEGITQGIAIGMAQEKVSIAKRLLALNIPLADVAKATGLTESELGKLQG